MHQWLLLIAQLLLFTARSNGHLTNDSWKMAYSNDHNCERKEKIDKLGDESCATNNVNDEFQAYEKCKQDLFIKLTKNCGDTQVKSKGKLLYCKTQGSSMVCCADKYTCQKPVDKDKSYKDKPSNYIKNKDRFFKKLKDQGYKTCHNITGLDATKCSDDCESESFKNGKLAKNCRKNHGLFKCCIRRDNENCDDCHWCCTLPFCTMTTDGGRPRQPVTSAPGQQLVHLTEQHLSDKTIEHSKHWKKVSAMDLVLANQKYFIDDDLRCFKPDNLINPANWSTYDPHEFLWALTEEDLREAKTIPIPVYKPNEYLQQFKEEIKDPEVFKRFVGPDYENQIKDNFSYDFVHRQVNTKRREACAEDCLRQENNSRLSKACDKKGGVFKCCIFEWSLSSYAPTNNLCENNTCLFCVGIYMCTFKDPQTGNRTSISVGGKTKYKMHHICSVMDYCNLYEKWYDYEKFYEAKTIDEFCKVPKIGPTAKNDAQTGKTENIFEDDGKTKYKKAEKIQRECVDRKTNIRICPKRYLKKMGLENTELGEVNARLRKFYRKKILKKHSKKRKRKSRRKKKRKKNSSSSSSQEEKE